TSRRNYSRNDHLVLMLREGKPAVNYENRGFHVGINRLSSSRSMTTNKWQRNHLRLVPRALLPCVVLILLGRFLTWLLHRLSCTAVPAPPPAPSGPPSLRLPALPLGARRQPRLGHRPLAVHFGRSPAAQASDASQPRAPR